MKSFLEYLNEEPRAAGFVRCYALTQKKRLEDQRKYIEGKASDIQDVCNAGLQQEGNRLTSDALDGEAFNV